MGRKGHPILAEIKEAEFADPSSHKAEFQTISMQRESACASCAYPDKN